MQKAAFPANFAESSGFFCFFLCIYFYYYYFLFIPVELARGAGRRGPAEVSVPLSAPGSGGAALNEGDGGDAGLQGEEIPFPLSPAAPTTPAEALLGRDEPAGTHRLPNSPLSGLASPLPRPLALFLW